MEGLRIEGLRAGRPRFERWREALVAESPLMRELVANAAQIAPTALPVLLQGETGTGKDVIARLLHGESGRPGPFVAFNCAAVPPGLADSELFGHVRGAFTGAERSHTGLFEQADRGTLLLDEVAELAPVVQAKLLRSIEDGEVRAVGATGVRPTNVRIVAASHRDLTRLVEEGRFRQDLYHRLAGFILVVPPLRERPDDIGPLTEQFLAGATAGRRRSLEPAAWNWLRGRLWPGNVRELRQCVQRAAALGGDPLTVADFVRLSPHAAQSVVPPTEEWLTGKSWDEIERAVLCWALDRYGSIRAAAHALDRPHSTMYDRVKHFGLACSTRR